MLWIVAVAYLIDLIMHYMIAELSYNNGARSLSNVLKRTVCWTFQEICYMGGIRTLGLSVVLNVSGFIAGAAAVFHAWFGLPNWAGMILYYILAASVIYFGMKLVGICEKISVGSMVAVIGILFVATLVSEISPLPTKFIATTNLVALYSTISLLPVSRDVGATGGKGIAGRYQTDPWSHRGRNRDQYGLDPLITFMTLLGAGSDISENGALVDLSAHLGGWVSIIGYIFSLLALSTSFWANTLNLRDIVHEQTKWNVKVSWLVSSVPCLLIALVGVSSFVGFTRLASVVQVLTGVGIIISYNRSRRREKNAPICGVWGTLPFRILVVVSTLFATIGALAKVY